MAFSESGATVWNNLCEHVAFVPRQQSGMLVRQWGPVLLVDSGLNCDTFNKIMIRPAEGACAFSFSRAADDTNFPLTSALTQALAHFAREERDFSVWAWKKGEKQRAKDTSSKDTSSKGTSSKDTSSKDTSSKGTSCKELDAEGVNQEQVLEQHGLEAVEYEQAMSVRLADVLSPEGAGLVPLNEGWQGQSSRGTTGNVTRNGTHRRGFAWGDFVIRPVETERELHAFAMVLAENWSPPEKLVQLFFEQAASVVLHPDGPMSLYVAWAGENPVACSELFMSGGGHAAGLHMVCTRKAFRCKGLGEAVTRVALEQGRRAGASLGVLVASGQGERLYARMGFEVLGDLAEYALLV